jgi:peptide/nickel transport system substrate-binding protein
MLVSSRARETCLMAMALIIAGCAPAGAPTASPSRGDDRSAASQRTLVFAIRAEPPSLASKPLVPVSGALAPPVSLFNATLDTIGHDGIPRPTLVEALPQANTESWRVSPDGRMETTYRLKPNLTWQDGQPLTAEDFVFAHRVYATPALGVASSPPIGQMEEVVAPDPRTVTIRWKQVFADAAALGPEFQALPSHILREPFETMDAQAFSSHPFWIQDYVGLGPYRVTNWEPGAFIEATAFDGYVLGKPTIERVNVRVISDPNTALANLLAADAHFVADFIFTESDGDTLEHQWASRGGAGGKVVYSKTELRATLFQFRPEHADPPGLLDQRVRSAVAHAIDAQTAVDVLTGGKGMSTFTVTSPAADFYPEVDRVITKHAYDPRRTEQLMLEAGFTRGPGGFFLDRAGQSFDPGLWSSGGTKNEQENAVIVDSLRRSGIDARTNVIPAAQVRDAQARALIPGLALRGFGAKRIDYFTSDQIPRADNRWQGDNRGGWSNAEYDQLYSRYMTTLERSPRNQLVAQMERVLTAELPLVPHFFGVIVNAHVGQLEGPLERTTPEASVGYFNVHQWRWKS